MSRPCAVLRCSIERGETVALVGESGSGKSVTALSVMQLLPYPRASHPHGSVRFDGEELLGTESARMQALRGNRVAMVFQEPMTSLNPLHSIEKQLCETLILHRGLSRAEARDRAMELLGLVGLPDVEERLDAWPHQLSGGQRQRVMIAMALANEPDLLIADEPTTALDVTIQAQILALLKDLQARLGMAILLITHDLGIVRHMADRVYVMSDGEIVEHNATESLFTAPQHPYTRTLLASEARGRTGSDRRGRARSHLHSQPQGPLSHQARSAAPHCGSCKSSRWNFAQYPRGADCRHRRRIWFGQDDVGAGALAAGGQRRPHRIRQPRYPRLAAKADPPAAPADADRLPRSLSLR